VADPEIDLTGAVIAEAMERAEKAICPPRDQRCYSFLYGVTEALATRTASGWCPNGRAPFESLVHRDAAARPPCG
jgi:hypothetical protein